jgi:hypothetical protein
MVTGDGMVGQPAKQLQVAGGPGVLEAADPQVAARHAGEHGPGQERLAGHGATGRDHGEGAGRGDAEGVHRLAHDVLAQHRADHRQPVASAGERRPAGTLEVQVPHPALAVDELAQQERASVTQPRDEPAELVPGVCLCHRRGALGDEVADEQGQPVRAPEEGGVEPELGGQGLVEHEQPRVGDLLRLPGHGQLRELPGEAVVEGEGRWGCEAHASRLRAPPAPPVRRGSGGAST